MQTCVPDLTLQLLHHHTDIQIYQAVLLLPVLQDDDLLLF